MMKLGGDSFGFRFSGWWCMSPLGIPSYREAIFRQRVSKFDFWWLSALFFEDNLREGRGSSLTLIGASPGASMRYFVTSLERVMAVEIGGS